VKKILSEKGLYPLVSMKQVDSYEHLPYVNELISLLVINEPGLRGKSIPDAEITRTVFFDRPVVRGSGSSWKLTMTTMPEDAGEWTHMFHGPDNIPYSQDKKVGPWVTGIRFTVADISSGRTHNLISIRGTRLAGGRMFIMGGVTGRREVQQVNFRVLDAASGLPLWNREIVRLDGNRTTQVPTDKYVVGYFNNTGPMLKLDAATGEELMSYDQGLSLKVGEVLGRGKEFAKRTKKIMGVFSLQSAQILVRDNALVQAYGNELVKLDLESGKRLWGYKAPKGVINHATMDENGHVYLYTILDEDIEHQKQFIHGPRVALVSLDAKRGKKRWEIDLEKPFALHRL